MPFECCHELPLRTRVVESNEVHEEKQTFFDKPDRMRFLPEFDPSLYKAQKIKVRFDLDDISTIYKYTILDCSHGYFIFIKSFKIKDVVA